MPSDPLIELRGVSKTYRLHHESGFSPWRRRLDRASRYHVALDNVSFTCMPGEVLGLIGPNGAGKSTLLKILSRVSVPESGRLDLRGRVASLLEVGAGFHPELTGRENIFLNGAILGMTKAAIETRFDEIAAFAGVERFLDTPVKRFSSGMRIRLAISVALHLDSDVVILDEVLAVGDATFQQQCLRLLESMAKDGSRATIVVSHNMQTIASICTRAIVLQGGRVTYDGDVTGAIKRYYEAVTQRAHASGTLAQRTNAVTGSQPVISTVNWVDGYDGTFAAEGPWGFVVALDAARLGDGWSLRCLIANQTGGLIAQSVNLIGDVFGDMTEVTVTVSMARLPLMPGRYRLAVILEDSDGVTTDKVDDVLDFDVLDAEHAPENGWATVTTAPGVALQTAATTA